MPGREFIVMMCVCIYTCIHLSMLMYVRTYLFNPWRACATRITVLVLCVCVCVYVCICLSCQANLQTGTSKPKALAD